MNADRSKPLVAIDVGNSQIMAGFFSPKIIGEIGNSLPEPHRVLSLQTQDWDPMEWNRWLAPLRPCDVNWCIGSVCDHAADVLQDWLKNESDDLFARFLDFRDLLIEIEIPSPASIGIDRHRYPHGCFTLLFLTSSWKPNLAPNLGPKSLPNRSGIIKR